jgi:hypothetical protein
MLVKNLEDIMKKIAFWFFAALLASLVMVSCSLSGPEMSQTPEDLRSLESPSSLAGGPVSAPAGSASGRVLFDEAFSPLLKYLNRVIDDDALEPLHDNGTNNFGDGKRVNLAEGGSPVYAFVEGHVTTSEDESRGSETESLDMDLSIDFDAISLPATTLKVDGKIDALVKMTEVCVEDAFDNETETTTIEKLSLSYVFTIVDTEKNIGAKYLLSISCPDNSEAVVIDPERGKDITQAGIDFAVTLGIYGADDTLIDTINLSDEAKYLAFNCIVD